MKAEFRAPMSKDRKPLITLLPLRSPLTIYIDPSSACNFKCRFCFQALQRQKNLGAMKWEVFERAASQLGEFESPIKMCHLHGFGEPFLNKNFTKMVRRLKDLGKVERIATTSNASLLTRDLACEILDCGLDQVHFSIYGLRDENYREFSGAAVRFGEIVENISYLYERKIATNSPLHIHIKINGDFYSERDRARFLELFGDLCDSIFIDGVANIWPSLDVSSALKINLSKDEKPLESHNLRHQYALKIQDSAQALPKDSSLDSPQDLPPQNPLCPNIFYQLMIHSNGDVSPCCADFMGALRLGNVLETSLKAIWEGLSEAGHSRRDSRLDSRGGGAATPRRTKPKSKPALPPKPQRFDKSAPKKRAA